MKGDFFNNRFNISFLGLKFNFELEISSPPLFSRLKSQFRLKCTEMKMNIYNRSIHEHSRVFANVCLDPIHYNYLTVKWLNIQSVLHTKSSLKVKFRVKLQTITVIILLLKCIKNQVDQNSPDSSKILLHGFLKVLFSFYIYSQFWSIVVKQESIWCRRLFL